MPVVFESGCVRRPLFAVKGRSLNYRVTQSAVRERVDTIADCFPTGSNITCREGIADVDSEKFKERVRVFVDDKKIN